MVVPVHPGLEPTDAAVLAVGAGGLGPHLVRFDRDNAGEDLVRQLPDLCLDEFEQGVDLLRRLEPVDHPADAVPPEEPVFHLKTKPRGIVHQGFATSFDSELAPGKSSDVIQAKLKKDGTPAAVGNDLATGPEIGGLLEYVKAKVGELADQIMDGKITVEPYKMRTETPCPHCEYRSVCRFQPGMNRYHHVEILGRDQVIQRINDKGGTDGQ